MTSLLHWITDKRWVVVLGLLGALLQGLFVVLEDGWQTADLVAAWPLVLSFAQQMRAWSKQTVETIASDSAAAGTPVMSPPP